MADTTPRLNTAPVDPLANYAPLSWMAAAAFGVVTVYAIVLIALIFFAFREGKPIIETWIFFPPALGILLAFAARRHIQNSENTRTGMEWANRAWWIGVVSCLGYAAYWAATEYTINRDTDKQFRIWADNLTKADLATPNDQPLSSAFYQTLPPNQRGAFSPSSTTEMQNRFGTDFVTFRQNKLLMLLQRNRGQCDLQPQGLKQWQQTPGKIECIMAAVLVTPEGEVPIIVPMQATVDKGKREWQIAAFDGYVPEVPGLQRTEYGWIVEYLEMTARRTAGQFLETASRKSYEQGEGRFLPEGILAQPVAFDIFCTRKIANPAVGPMLIETAFDRANYTGALGLFWPKSAEYQKAMQGGFFVQTPLPDGRMVPDASREDFLFCWNGIGLEKIVLGGRILNNSTEKNCLIRFFDDRVEVSVPIELKVPKADPRGAAALGRLVLTLQDPTFLAEIVRTRNLGTKGERSPTMTLPTILQNLKPEWTVTRIESNLKVIRTIQTGGAPGGG